MDAKKDNRQNSPPPDTSAKTAPRTQPMQRRRIGVVVRDDRDAASVEWVDAPANYDRVQLSLEATLPPGTKAPPMGGYDPYETVAKPKPRQAAVDKKPATRDLRKLSEWIKQMRELEERKKRGEI